MTKVSIALSELTEDTRPITYGVVKPGPEDNETGVRFVRGGDVKEGKIKIDELRTITQDVSAEYKRTLLKGGELLISLVGNPGEVALAPVNLIGANIARQVGLVALRPEVNSKYVMYFLQSPLGRSRMFQRTQGAVQQVINLKDLREILIDFPSPEKQTKIVESLERYDDLIDNNRRRIALLEESARLLYREWFVHFRFPGAPPDQSEQVLPKHWKTCQVKDVLSKVKSRPKIKKEDYQEQAAYPCVDQSKTFVGGYTDNEDAIYEEELPLVIFGDHTRCLKYIDFTFARGADGTQICKSSSPNFSDLQLYLALKEIDLSNYFYARHFKFLKDQKLTLPNPEISRQFNGIVTPIFDQISNLRKQSAKAVEARDQLLPRLMDGRVTL